MEILTQFDPVLLASFILAGLLLNITPGADFILVTTSGISGGPRAGIAAALGINLGIILHVLMAAAGLSALLQAYPLAYDLIRYLGGLYLLWLALQSWRAHAESRGNVPNMRPKQAFLRGFTTNILNPKTALFIFAFIPQFTDPDIGSVEVQLLILGLIFMLNGLIFSLCLGMMAGQFSSLLRRHAAALNKVTAILFGGLAAKLMIN